MVWSFLSQVLRDGKEVSCQSAVAREEKVSGTFMGSWAVFWASHERGGSISDRDVGPFS